MICGVPPHESGMRYTALRAVRELFIIHFYDHAFPLCGRHKKRRKSLVPSHAVKNLVLKYA